MWFYYVISIFVGILLGIISINELKKTIKKMAIINVIQSAILVIIGIIGFVFYTSDSYIDIYLVIGLVVTAASIVIPSYIIDKKTKRKNKVAKNDNK